jgi:hypothetical protein
MGNILEVNGCGIALRLYPGICSEGLSKTTKFLTQASQSLRRDLNS